MPSVITIVEACTDLHFMARRISSLGYEAWFISPRFIRPFVKTNKNDYVDAEPYFKRLHDRLCVQFKTENQQEMQTMQCIKDSLLLDKVKTTKQMHAFCWSLVSDSPKAMRL
jgi:hypothetical protein